MTERKTLPRTLALWRVQAAMIVRGLAKRDRQMLAKKLEKAVEDLERMWVEEFGPAYLCELEDICDLNNRIQLAEKADAASKGTRH